VFCEVRARVGRPAAGIDAALASIGPGKQRQLRRMAGEWFGASAHRGTRRTRFDAVAVALAADGRPLAIRHVRDAF
jgi:Holliday junction resolvase-like predicted endonuclease